MGRWFSNRTRRGRLDRASRWGQRVGDSRRSSIEMLETRVLLAGDLVAHWRADTLNEGHEDGQVVSSWTDATGGAQAVASGSPILAKDVFSGRSVVRFDTGDGADSFTVAAADHPMSGADDFTIAVVFATSSLDLQGGTNKWFDGTGLVTANRLGWTTDWGITLNGAGQVGAGTGSEPVRSVYSTQTGLNDGQFHLATFTSSGSRISLYVDDAVATRVTDADAATRDDIDMRFGILEPGLNPLTGDLAEIRVYDGELDDAEVAGLHNEINGYYNNLAPVASDDSYTLPEDPGEFGVYSVSAANGVLSNDTDPESDPLTAVLADDAAHGEITLRPDGSFIYIPEPDFFGTDSFTYTAQDAQTSNVATVTLNVTNVYDPAVAVADSYKTVPTQTLSMPADQGVLANDQNPDQVDLSAVLVTDDTPGSLTLSSDGSFEYDPQGNAGTASFTYQIDDGTQLSEPVGVSIVVNTPPQAVTDNYVLDEDATLIRDAANGVTANDVDPEGQTLVVSRVEIPLHGSLELFDDGSFSYLPDTDFFGADQFTYQLSDGEDTSNTAIVNLTIQSVNDAPVGTVDAYFIQRDQQLVISAADGLLANDSDVDDPVLTVTLEQEPSHGELQLQPDGGFTYTPQNAYEGMDTFIYLASDGQDDSGPVTVTLFVGTPPLQISEVMAANVGTMNTRVREEPDDIFRGERLTPDWIELRNLTSSPLDISGYHLTDQGGAPQRWAFPSNTIISPNGYLVVFADRLNITDPALDEAGLLHTNFKLDVAGEYLAVTSPEGEVLDQYDPGYPAQRADVSFGVTGDGTLGYLLAATPGEENTDVYPGVVADPVLTVDRGFFTEAFPVEIATTTPGATIRYTLDGSPPNTSNGELYGDPITITTTTVLKATAFKENFLPSNVMAQTYIFAADVLQQDGSELGGVRWGHAGQDWEMDPEIVNHTDPEIRPEAEDLLRLPTVSLSLDFDSMWGNGGIYIRGENVETPVAFEFFDPSRPDSGVQTNSTVQIVGGSSPNRWKVDKLSMRVRFTEDQGASELDYPVFGSGATTSFDTLVVDARMNNTWHYGGGVSPTFQRNIAQYLRDEFAADMQNEMGGYGPHLQHVHVYINGIYWGMHILHERPDDNFAASYLGGLSEDYDALKHTASTVVNGSNENYRELNNILGRSGDLSDEQYQQAAELLEIDDFIDYMLVNIYGANRDWDHHNWYATRNRIDGKWRFHSWDAEKVLQGINDDVTTVNNANAPTGMHRRLMTHPEYQLKFADHVQQHFYHDGVLTPEVAAEIYKFRSDQIDLVMRVESARWGDNQIDNGNRKRYTRPDWVANLDGMMDDYFPRRTDIVIRQMERRDWFESGIAPEFSINGTPQHGGFIDTDSILSMEAPEGTIYFTTDGSDPRVEGGEVSPTAQVYSNALPLTATTTVRARLRTTDDSWSPVSEARFVTSVPADASSLRISEVHYHPADMSAAEIAAGFDSPNDFEFVELVNISDHAIDLAKVQFEQVTVGNDVHGLDFAFADGSVGELAPGERVLVVEDLAAFQLRYGTDLPVAGQWNGGLGNRSERVLLTAGDQTIHDFTYDDSWHPTTDGDGPSLQIEDERGELDLWNFLEGWRPSLATGGSPGTVDALLPGDSNHDGIFNSTDMVVVFQAGEYEDGIADNSTFEEGDWNGDGDFDTQDMIYVFQLGHYSTAARPQLALPIQPIDGAVAAAVLAESRGLPLADATSVPAESTREDDAARPAPSPVDLPLPAEDQLFDEWGETPDQDQITGDGESLDGELLDLLATGR